MNATRIEEVSATDREARQLVERYIAELRKRLGEFDPARSISAEPEEMEAPNGVFLVARVDGVAVACGGLKRFRDGVGELKRMFVVKEARGRGHGRRILEALEARARELGFRELVLDTAAPLVEATELYRSAGFEAVDAYNDNPYAARWFRKRLG
jgi:GNAT superfamily N-acetyltransferase